MYLYILKTDEHTIMASAVSTQKSACRNWQRTRHQFSLSETAAGGGGTPFFLGNLPPSARSPRAPRA